VIRRVLRHLPVALRGRPLRGLERYRPFFIVGSGRCGTTLLRAMLEAHPDVHIPPETHLPDVMRDYQRYSRLPWHAVLRIILTRFEYHPQWDGFVPAFGPVYRDLSARAEDRNLAAVLDAVYRAHATRYKPTATRWGDKTPLNALALNGLHTVFPDLRAIHMVRDGRDVVQSFMRRTNVELSAAARAWLRPVRTAQQFGVRHPAQYREIRYEDLVRQPQVTIEAVCAFLDLPLDERSLRHHELDLPLADVDRFARFQGVRGPLHQAEIGRWRTDLSATQIDQLDALLGPTLSALGYEDR